MQSNFTFKLMLALSPPIMVLLLVVRFWQLEAKLLYALLVVASLVGAQQHATSRPNSLPASGIESPNRLETALADDVRLSNAKWICEGCGDDIRNHQLIFSWVRRALITESREAYLNFDHSWIDAALSLGENVVVQHIHREKLCDYYMPDDIEPPAGLMTSRLVHETLYVVISLPTDIRLLSPLPFREALKIDRFLTNNPCWLPMRDPIARQYTANYPISNDISNASELPTCNNVPEQAEQPIPPLYHLSSDKLERWYQYSAIFVRLPAMNYYATCQLYTFITRRQFPERCPSIDEHSSVYVSHVSNIGWSHCVDSFLVPFRDSLAMDRLFLVPATELHGHQRTSISISFDGRSRAMSSMWKWADLYGCDNYTLALNVWSCHFIPLTNCTHPDWRAVRSGGTYKKPNHDDSKANKQTNSLTKKKTRPGKNSSSNGNNYGTAAGWIPPIEYNAFRGKLRILHSQYLDMWTKDEKSRLYLRLKSFVQRPNIQTRWRLRDAILNVREISNATNLPHPPHAVTHEQGAVQRLVHFESRTPPLMTPCVGLHVRSGDSLVDWRGDLAIDRSAKHFAALARNFSRSLGMNNIYIATDNASVISDVVRMFPDANWFTQFRLLSQRNGELHMHQHEESRKEDIAAILADLVVMSRCGGFVGSYDSTFTWFLMQYQCIRNKYGRCPPHAGHAYHQESLRIAHRAKPVKPSKGGRKSTRTVAGDVSTAFAISPR